MNTRDLTLLIAATLLTAVGIGGLLATADMEPCWPECKESTR